MVPQRPGGFPVYSLSAVLEMALCGVLAGLAEIPTLERESSYRVILKIMFLNIKYVLCIDCGCTSY